MRPRSSPAAADCLLPPPRSRGPARGVVGHIRRAHPGIDPRRQGRHRLNAEQYLAREALSLYRADAVCINPYGGARFARTVARVARSRRDPAVPHVEPRRQRPAGARRRRRAAFSGGARLPRPVEPADIGPWCWEPPFGRLARVRAIADYRWCRHRRAGRHAPPCVPADGDDRRSSRAIPVCRRRKLRRRRVKPGPRRSRCRAPPASRRPGAYRCAQGRRPWWRRTADAHPSRRRRSGMADDCRARCAARATRSITSLPGARPTPRGHPTVRLLISTSACREWPGWGAQRLRAHNDAVPVLILTAADSVERVRGR